MMVDPLYSRLQGTASGMIGKYGQDAILRKRSVSGGSLTPWRPDSTYTDHPIKITLLPTEKDGKETITSRESEQRQGEITAYMPADSVKPEGDDLIVCGGSTYRIKSIDEYNPAGLPVMYRLTLNNAS